MGNGNVIETHTLRRRFGAVTAVAGVDLRVPAGSIYGFLGPNGAGKTTTIRMLLGLIRPDAGEVWLFGRLLTKGRRDALRRVGSLVENPSFYPNLTGRENLEVFRRLLRVSRQRVERALTIVGLEDAAGRRAGHYSLGMRQRLGLAMALLGEAELLILDEPTNGLDPAGIREMRDLVRRLAGEQGMTVFLSSPLLSEVEQVATHVGIIHQGAMLFQGRLGELHARLQAHVILVVGNADRAEGVLGEAGWKVLSDGSGRLTVAAGTAADAAQINSQLVAAGIDVQRVSLEQPSLEDVFLTLTDGGVSAKTPRVKARARR